MQKLYFGLLIIIILLIGAFYYNFSTKPSLEGETPVSTSTDETNAGSNAVTPKSPKPTTSQSPKSPSPSASGRVLFGVTDATAPLSGIKSILLSINKLSVHSTQGWLDIPVGTKTYDLLALRKDGSIQLLADTNLAVDTNYGNSRNYGQIRLNISEVKVLLNTGETKTAKLPSGDIKIIGSYTAKRGATGTVVFDFVASQSLHTSVDGTYIFAPVLKFESKTDAIVEVGADQKIKIGGGTSKVEVAVGMNENSEVKNNFALNPNLQIEILPAGTWKILNPGESDASLKISAVKAIEIAINNGAISSALSLRLSEESSGIYWAISGMRGDKLVIVKVHGATGAIAD